MKRYFFILIGVCSFMLANAQYSMGGFPLGLGTGLGWGTEAGSPAWYWQQQQLINIQDNYLLQMRMQQLNMMNQQLRDIESQIMANPTKPVEGVFYHNDGTPFNYDTIKEYDEKEEACEHCDGGYNTRRIYMGNGNVSTIKNRCSFCHGKGTITKHVLKN